MNNEDTNIDVEKNVNHWIETSDEDYNTMLILNQAKSYNWALFLGHVSLERLLKAFYVKAFRKHAPFTHNLFRLVELCNFEISDEYSDWFDKITSFNLNARYYDYKREFYNMLS
jgi:HEPN domain-containing protein